MKLIEQILSTENVLKAQSHVLSNKGGVGVDGMHVDELAEYMRQNWDGIKQSILERKYKPAPVRRVDIPKANGGVRKLGIPTVLDRTIQQSIVQVLSPIFEEEFQEHSYGFRPCRNCEQAVLKLLEYLNEGYEWIVDIDLEKFFDHVPQDKLMSYVGRVIHDPDTESLIRKYLKSGVMENGVYSATEEGTPQNESTMQLAVVSRSMQENGKTRLSAGEFTPDWDNSVASAKNDLMCYDVPIDCEHTYKAVWLSTETGTPTLEAVDVYQKLVLVKNRVTGKLGQFLLTLIPDIAYERQHQGEVADLFINAGDKGGFTGVAIYSIPGIDLIVRANRYTNGIKTRGVHMSGNKKDLKENVFWLKAILRPFKLIRCSSVQSRGAGEDMIMEWVKQGNTVEKIGDCWVFSDENGEQFRMEDSDGDGEPDSIVILPENGNGENTEPTPDPDPEDENDLPKRCDRCGLISCNGNCVTPGGGGSGGDDNNEINKNQVTASQLTSAAKSAVNYINKKYGKIEANCNRGVIKAFEILFGDSEFQDLKANEMTEYWIDHPDAWQPIPMSQAQELANQGYFVVAGWINPDRTKSGHVVVVVPGEMQSGWGTKVPCVMDTGYKMRAESQKLSISFHSKKRDGIIFFKYIKK